MSAWHIVIIICRQTYYCVVRALLAVFTTHLRLPIHVLGLFHRTRESFQLAHKISRLYKQSTL